MKSRAPAFYCSDTIYLFLCTNCVLFLTYYDVFNSSMYVFRLFYFKQPIILIPIYNIKSNILKDKEYLKDYTARLSIGSDTTRFLPDCLAMYIASSAFSI